MSVLRARSLLHQELRPSLDRARPLRPLFRLLVPLDGSEWTLRETGAPPEPGLYCMLEGLLGSAVVRIALHADIVEACLRLAPDPVRPEDLEPSSAALLAEHILTPALDRLERRLGRRTAFVKLMPAQWLLPPGPLSFAIDAGAGWRPLHVSIGDATALEAIDGLLQDLEARGPAGIPGLPLAIGPLHLPADGPPLAAGDRFLITEGTPRQLGGAVFLDGSRGWPVQLNQSRFEVAGAFRDSEAAWSRPGCRTLFLDWGRTVEAGPMSIGGSHAYRPLDARDCLIIEDGAEVATARLVPGEQGVEFEIVGVRDTP